MSLKYREKLTNQPDSPLLCLVHGRAGNQDVMWTFQRTFPETATIVAPEAPIADPIGGFSWWKVENRANREEIDKAVLLLRNFIVDYITSNQLRPSKILALGFSQGAALLSIFLQREPTFFSAVGLLAGLVLKEESPPTPLPSLPKIFIAHGSKDETVPIVKCYEGRDWLIAKGYSVEFCEDPVGHKVGSSGIKNLAQFLKIHQ